MIPNQTRAVLRPIIIGASAKCENCEVTLRGNYKSRPQQVIVNIFRRRKVGSHQTLLHQLLRRPGPAIWRGNRVSENDEVLVSALRKILAQALYEDLNWISEGYLNIEASWVALTNEERAAIDTEVGRLG